jgi:hypothetical protein
MNRLQKIFNRLDDKTDIFEYIPKELLDNDFVIKRNNEYGISIIVYDCMGISKLRIHINEEKNKYSLYSY